MRAAVAWVLLLLCTGCAGVRELREPRTWDFQEDPVDAPPAGWVVPKDGVSRPTGDWRITVDKTAPGLSKVLRQHAIDRAADDLNLVVADTAEVSDFRLRVWVAPDPGARAHRIQLERQIRDAVADVERVLARDSERLRRELIARLAPLSVADGLEHFFGLRPELRTALEGERLALEQDGASRLALAERLTTLLEPTGLQRRLRDALGIERTTLARDGKRKRDLAAALGRLLDATRVADRVREAVEAGRIVGTLRRLQMKLELSAELARLVRAHGDTPADDPVDPPTAIGVGIAFRYRGPRDHYALWWDVPAHRLVLQRVQDGTRTELATADVQVLAEDLAQRRWHQITVAARGGRLAVAFASTPLIDIVDAEAAPLRGQIAFWTRADAVASYDDLAVQPLAPLGTDPEAWTHGH